MKYGQIRGREETWHENGNPKLVAECEFGIYLSKKEWDINGNLINEKTNILEDELEILNSTTGTKGARSLRKALIYLNRKVKPQR